MKKLLLIIPIVFLSSQLCVLGQENKFSLGLNGQLIGWANFNFPGDFTNQWGVRYLPELFSEYKFNNNWKLDATTSLNTYGIGTYFHDDFTTDGDLRPYRIWLRLSSDRFFLRAGLQKINFGSASILRPLMWFDKIDPRDPLQLTDGVYGVLARYYFLNNANIWLWGLYGNDRTRGWEAFASDRKVPEYGGRIQIPLGPGEIALSYHHRTVGKDSIFIPAATVYAGFDKFRQDRLAIDGKWDLGIGLWFENSVQKNHKNELLTSQKWTDQLNLGADYTFGLGNGLNVQLEHLLWVTGEDLFNDTEKVNYTALSANYPFGMFDRISTILYYNWKDDQFYRFLNWSREYDKIVFYLMAYWNPETFDIYRNTDDVTLFSGKGFQFMIVFNH